ncbi:3-hydroxy-3-methylglutaryl-coenzyme A reductase [Contarinia nasturtii]|uniref:3-hydroxy-3-methylglutaryl-coenzyme A reductase n=1 Tax=Contarinia nasturtii TaxID=265458 RepID=UPI0012D3A5DE|nr:3-hydroxy-3-methylglutaryl-coenzyme A reductase [Contarinia nasturtii]
MTSQLFRAHGKFCASHPWEVIVALLTLTACMLSVDHGKNSTPLNKNQGRGDKSDGAFISTILMTIIGCWAVLHSFYRFLKLNKIGSKYIPITAGLFIIFSNFIFTSMILNFLGGEVSDLKDALFFFLLLIDLRRVGAFAQFVFSGASQSEVVDNISRGMEILGPALSLDSIVTTLIISVCTSSGFSEKLCSFAMTSVIVNYVVFMTFYPACLSLISDLSMNGLDIGHAKQISTVFEDDQKPNPVAQRLKIIMSTGLMIVQLCSRFVFSDSDAIQATKSHDVPSNSTDKTGLSEHVMEWIKVSSDQIIILILLTALLVKFMFFEERIELTSQLNQTSKINSQTIVSNTVTGIATQTNKKMLNQYTQTEIIERNRTISTHSIDSESEDSGDEDITIEPRTIEECQEILNTHGGSQLTDSELIALVRAGHCPLYKIETYCDNPTRGVKIRRKVIADNANLPIEKLSNLPYKHFDYTKVMNVCCENVMGYVQIPVGYAGPLTLDDKKYFVPMATTEGALVASTNRGCKVISIHGVTSFVEDIGMTRAPCIRFPNVHRASVAKKWIDAAENFQNIKTAFDSTSRFARLQEILINIDGPQLYVRFRALTGDAMGMNMVSKGCENALRYIKCSFPDMTIISLSGNFCSDKKPAAINWIKGRGKRVVCESIVAASDLRKILKTDAKTLVQCNKLKNMAGSAMAGSIGGNNAHAANMVTAIFIACGQDPAQNVTSSNCSTSMELCGDNNDDLYLTCTMPSLEVGTVGGGTGLPGQSSCLDMLGIRGAHPTTPADNSKTLAKIVCATVMAGELSLMAALVNSDLVQSHMKHNRTSVASAMNQTANSNISSNSSSSPSTVSPPSSSASSSAQ